MKCKGANAAVPRAKVQRWEANKRAGTWDLRMNTFTDAMSSHPYLIQNRAVACAGEEMDILNTCSVLSKRPEWSRDQS